jgi:Zn-dependent protease with chaperone function
VRPAIPAAMAEAVRGQGFIARYSATRAVGQQFWRKSGDIPGSEASNPIMKRSSPFSAFLLIALAWPYRTTPADSKIEISDADEIRIGAALAKDFEQEEGMAPTPQSIKLDGYLQNVGDKVAANARRKLPYRFHFDPSPGFRSAVGLPGGQIYVGAGILAYTDTEDQLAVVLGHEIEHVDLSQCRERLIKVLGEQHLTVKDGEKLKVDPFLDGYGHDNEFAADREGVILAMKAGYSADGGIRLLQTFVILGEQMPNTSSEAKANLEARIAQIRVVRDGSNLPRPAKEKSLALP